MFRTIFFAFLAFWVALLPMYLWGYGISYLSGTPWNRRRFLIGMVTGAISVGLIWLFSYATLSSICYILAVSIFILILSAIVYMLIRGGSIYARGLLQKMATTNIGIITTLIILVLVISRYTPGISIVIISIIPLLISSLIEESSKHLMSIGLMSQDFAFSRRDIIIFTLFVVLGFVFVENLLYLIQGNFTLSTWIFRSFFSLVAHLLSASICAYAWWRALSYEPFSLRYIAIFAIGFLLAVLTHLCYNLILQEGSMIGLFLYMIVGYVVITRGIFAQEKCL